MSKVSNVKDGALIKGYDSLAAAQWCTPSFLGCNACVSASAVKGQVTITVSLNTPFGNVSKSFNFNTNVSFTWQPFSRFKVTFSVSNLNESDRVFSFDLGLKACVDVPVLGWKCFDYSHHFVVPTVLAGIHNDIDDSQFSSLLSLHAGGNPASSLLQGDIYNDYAANKAQAGGFPTTSCVPTLSCIPTTASCVTGVSPICATQEAAAFPTIPITKCIPIPTVKCIPTVTSCVTGVSPICATQNAQAGGFPTTSCVPTLSCIPTTASCVTGVSPICATQEAAAFPTIPVTKCLPIPTVKCIPTVTSCVTGVSPICATQNAQAGGFPTTSCVPTLSCIPTTASCVTGVSPICATQEAAAFPTIPVTKCLPIPTVKCIPTVTSCVTGVSPICATQNAEAGGFPTTSCVPTLSCIPTTASCVTGVSPICATQEAAAFPTIPVTKCLPIPTVKCIPTVTSCVTGVSPICATQQGNVGTPAVPTLPVDKCVPTVSCVPTISCIPTVACTGIPFVC